jgi:hypothetical protein
MRKILFFFLFSTVLFSCKDDIDYVESLSKDIVLSFKENDSLVYSKLNFDIDELESWINSKKVKEERDFLLTKLPQAKKDKRFSKEKFVLDFKKLREVPIVAIDSNFWNTVEYSDFKYTNPVQANSDVLLSIVIVELSYEGKIYKLTFEAAKQGDLDWQITKTPNWEELVSTYDEKKLKNWQPEIVSDKYFKISKSNLCSLIQLDSILFKQRISSLGYKQSFVSKDRLSFTKTNSMLSCFQTIEYDLASKVLNIVWVSSDVDYFTEFESVEKENFVNNGSYMLEYNNKKYVAKIGNENIGTYIKIAEMK